MFNLLLITVAPILGVYSSKNMNMTERTGKVFSLFSVVQFPNEACTSSSTVFPKGTCFASSECSAKSGTAYGNCAAGFGVCCVFTSSTCGSTVSQNCTYITNPGYPSSYTTTGTCEFTVNKCSADICQLRLDFIALALNTATGTTAAATCLGCCGSGCTSDCIAASAIATATDSLTVTGQTGVNPPVICGINTGYHMYLETGTTATDSGLLSFYMAQAGNRQWKIKVSQIACASDWRVPSQCVQYFTGVAGDVQSYGFGSGQLLLNQKYDNCIRQEEGYCQITWAESATSTPDPFQFPEAPAIFLGQNALCTNAWVFIQGGDMGNGANTGLGNTWCGEALFCDACAAPVVPTPITSSSFYLGVFSDGSLKDPGSTANTAATGFNLKYNQIPC